MENLQAIKIRKSVRNYTDKALSEEHEAKLLQFINDESKLIGPFGNSIRIVYKKLANQSNREKIGTYGFVKNAPAFLICICKNDEESLLDLGFVFENLILFLRTYGIGTCWLGGTFKRKKLELEHQFSDGEFIPIISPLGYGAEKLHLVEKLVRKGAKANTRLDFNHLFFNSDFNTSISDPLNRELLEYVRLAPSASNKQPWRIILGDNKTAHFFIERTPKYGSSLSYDIQMVDIGIALSHFVAAYGKQEVFKENPNIKLPNEFCTYVLSIKISAG